MALLAGFILLLLATSFSANAADLTECPSDISPNLVYYNTKNTTSGSVFQQNLSGVYRSVINRATFRTGSIQASAGTDPNQVYGYSACFGGFQFPGDCVQCLINIRSNFDKVAPLAVGAQQCYKQGNQSCYLRYENYSFY